MKPDLYFPTVIDAASVSPVLLHPASVRPGPRQFVSLIVRPSAGAMLAWRLEVANDDAAAHFASATGNNISHDVPMSVRHTHNLGVAYTNDTVQVTDGNPLTVADWDGLNTIANQNWFIAGYHSPFNGLSFTLAPPNINAVVANMAIENWSGVAWAAMTGLVDGTRTGATPNFVTLSQNGLVTWTMPADWRPSTIDTVTTYHIRGSVSAQISANVDIDEVRVLLDASQFIEVVAPVTALRMSFSGVTGADTIPVDTTIQLLG